MLDDDESFSFTAWVMDLFLRPYIKDVAIMLMSGLTVHFE